MTDTAEPPQSPAGPRAARIRARLEAGFAPCQLAVADDSARHAGHAGAGDAGETHYRVDLVSAAFRGLARVARSRAVHAALAEEFATGLHALALRLRTPEEYDRERPAPDEAGRGHRHPRQQAPGQNDTAQSRLG
jgi:BolA protein